MNLKIEYNDLVCKTEKKEPGGEKKNLNLSLENCETITKELTFVSSESQKKWRKKAEVKECLNVSNLGKDNQQI